MLLRFSSQKVFLSFDNNKKWKGNRPQALEAERKSLKPFGAIAFISQCILLLLSLHLPHCSPASLIRDASDGDILFGYAFPMLFMLLLSGVPVDDLFPSFVCESWCYTGKYSWTDLEIIAIFLLASFSILMKEKSMIYNIVNLTVSKVKFTT